MANAGVVPPDGTTDVGLLRTLIDDTGYVPLVPPVAGQGDYALFSDAHLETSLTIANGSVYRAAGDLYAALAAQYAQKARNVATDDLRISTEKRSDALLALAENFYARADATDAAESNDFFEVVPFATRSTRTCRVEGSPWPVDC